MRRTQSSGPHLWPAAFSSRRLKQIQKENTKADTHTYIEREKEKWENNKSLIENLATENEAECGQKQRPT